MPASADTEPAKVDTSATDAAVKEKTDEKVEAAPEVKKEEQAEAEVKKEEAGEEKKE